MSIHRFLLDLEVNDEILREHDEEHPPPKNLAEWDARDLVRAEEEMIVDLAESEASYIGPLSKEDS